MENIICNSVSPVQSFDVRMFKNGNTLFPVTIYTQGRERSNRSISTFSCIFYVDELDWLLHDSKHDALRSDPSEITVLKCLRLPAHLYIYKHVIVMFRHGNVPNDTFHY